MTSLLRAVVLIDKGNSENKERRVATSSDAGETWKLSESVINDVNDKHIDILAIDPNSQIVYGSWKGQGKDQSQLYKSIDGGAHWSSISSSSTAYASIFKLIIHPKNSNLLYRLDSQSDTFGHYYQWLISNDAGLNWQSIIAEK